MVPDDVARRPNNGLTRQDQDLLGERDVDRLYDWSCQMYGAEQKREKKCCVLLTKQGGWPLYKAYAPHLTIYSTRPHQARQ